MPKQWTGDFVGEVHNAGLTIQQVAKEASLNPKYVSQILHSENPSESARKKLFDALGRLKEA